MSLLLLLRSSEAPDGETMAAGDLTTAFSKWLAGEGHPKNEAIRAALNTSYSTSYADIAPPVARFLKDRQ